MREYFIGLDIGTSSVKAVAFDLQGRFIQKKSAPCRTLSPAPGRQEQDPDAIYRLVVKVLRQIVSENGPPAAVSLSSAMHSLISLDEAGTPLTPAMLWSDTRAGAAAGALKGTPLGKEIYRVTGTPIHPMSPLLKLDWLRKHEPGIFKKTHKFLGIKEYLVFKLTGEFFTDYSMASATGLFDSSRLEWFAPALDFAAITAAHLPQPVSPFFILKNLNKNFLRQTGLPAGVPLLIGASDGCLANLGAGAVGPGEAVLTIGTSGALRMFAQSPKHDPLERIFNYLLFENQYVTGGASNNGGVVYEWFTSTFFNAKPADGRMVRRLNALAQVPAGSDGLLHLPYLLGERAPIWNASARGVFYGITTAHTSAHFRRAVLEGILLNLCIVGLVLENTVAPISRLLVDGGYTKMDFWVQMTADVFGKEVITLESEDAPALGAALLAMKELGCIEDFAAVKRMVQQKNTFQPDEKNHRIYSECLEYFKEIYSRLEGAFRESV